MTPTQPGVWIPFAVLIIISVGWAITVTSMMRVTKKDCTRLLWLLEHPHKAGFGTDELREIQAKAAWRTDQLIEDNTRAMKALTHYIVWFIKESSGKTPPPPVPVETI